MNVSPYTLTAAACAAVLLVSQVSLPTVRALSLNAPVYRVQVQGTTATRTVSGLMITGRVVNTGSKPLTYTRVMPVLEDQTGKTVYTGNGYLTVSPLLPGQAAEFRACEPDAPAFRRWHITFREAGCPVLVEESETSIRQGTASRR
jgi:hypothetical protein